MQRSERANLFKKRVQKGGCPFRDIGGAPRRDSCNSNEELTARRASSKFDKARAMFELTQARLLLGQRPHAGAAYFQKPREAA